ncbi:MAG: hypothetical protein ACN6Q5_08830 [Pseudomonas sp.]|uniref:hypothetical protein n=1 Tax=Pseudomonas sp. TaxID=306 RepID=UPI003D0E2D80
MKANKQKIFSIILTAILFSPLVNARPISYEMEAITIYGNEGGGSKRNPIGDGWDDYRANKQEAARKAAEEKAAAAAVLAAKAVKDKAAADKAAADKAEADAELARQEALRTEREKLKIYAKEIALEVGSDAAKMIGGPVLWAVWETGTRLLDPTDIGHHPMESGTQQASPEQVRELRQKLDKDAAQAREQYEREHAGLPHPAISRSLTSEERAMISVAKEVSDDSSVVTETLIRYGNGPYGNNNFGSQDILDFIKLSKLPYANACWSPKEKVARTIPYTAEGGSCTAYDANGKETKKPGVTVYRAFANVCSVKWGTCPLAVKEVIGAPCGCVGPSRPGYGKASLSE